MFRKRSISAWILRGALNVAPFAIAALASNGALALGPQVSPQPVAPVGSISFPAIAFSPSNFAALHARHAPVALKRHRLPRLPSEVDLAAPPRLAASNAMVMQAHPAGLHVSGFGGLTAEDTNLALGFALEPPDQGLGVNNKAVVEFINDTLRIYKTDGTPLTPVVSAPVFFQWTDPNDQMSDPYVVYDPAAKRWFLSILILNNATKFYGFAVAVSKTSSPFGAFWLYHIPAFSTDIAGCGGEDCFPDYPKAGYDANGYFLTADLYSNVGSGDWVNASIYVMPKAKLKAGASFLYDRFSMYDFVVVPAIPAPGEPFVTSNGGTEFLMTARLAIEQANLFNDTTTPDNLRLWAVYNTKYIAAHPGRLLARSVDIKPESYNLAVPATEPDVIGPYCQSQGATAAAPLDGGYTAFGGGVKLAGGKLIAALASGAIDGNGMARDILSWFVVEPTLGHKLINRIPFRSAV